MVSYIDGTNPLVTFKDGYEVKEKFGINMRDIGYTLSKTEEFNLLLEEYEKKGWKF